MRRWATLTSVFVLLAMTMALATGEWASASASRAPGASAAHAIRATKVKVAKVKPGSAWTLRTGTVCEIETFSPGHKFVGMDGGKGDQGTYKGARKLTMTWTAGSSTGDVFTGTFSKAGGSYSGPYSRGAGTAPATLVPVASFGCDVVTTAPEENSISLGNSDADTATVVGQVGATPTGNVHFYVCPGNAHPCTTTSDGVADLGSTQLTGSGSSASAFSAGFTPSAVGSYCFLGVYSGDSHYASASDQSTTDECFTVTAAVPGVTTHPFSPSVVTNANNHDIATVTGTGSVTPTGTVTFYVCGPNTGGPCTAQAGTLIGSPVTVAPTQASATASASSANFSSPTTGTYCFIGVYSGDSNYAASSDSSTSNECFLVTGNVTT